MNILFTGIGGPTPLGIAKSVKMAWPKHRCIGIDASEWATSLYQSDVFDKTYKVPLASDTSYWEVIDHLIALEKIDFAFIVPETEVLVWADRTKTGTLPCKVHIPSSELSNFCFDKEKVASILFPHGLAPKTVEIQLSQFSELNKVKLDFPFWIRIKTGAGALGSLRVNTDKDLTSWLSINEDKCDFIASEYLAGRNYACKLLYHDGEIIQSASAERIDYLLSAASPSGISGMCARGKLLNRPDLVERSKSALTIISKHLGSSLNGMFTIDFKENAQGEPLITEINIRHVSFTLAFSMGGVNFAESTLRLFFDQNFKKSDQNTFSTEYYFLRGVDASIRLVSEKELKGIKF